LVFYLFVVWYTGYHIPVQILALTGPIEIGPVFAFLPAGKTKIHRILIGRF
jgi:hypothetical protein